MITWLLGALGHAHAAGILHRDIKRKRAAWEKAVWEKVVSFQLSAPEPSQLKRFL